MWVTLKFNLIIIPLQIIIAFIMAMIVNVKVRGIEIFRTVFLFAVLYFINHCNCYLADDVECE